MTFAEVIAAAEQRLRGAGIDTARLDAEVLLARAADLSRSGVFARMPDTVPPTVRERCDDFLARRCAREPVAYITGEKEFYSLSMRVSPAVLIPRPETELVVEAALNHAPPRARLCDVGTGSGCIAIALAVRRPDIRVVACDLSPAALAVAAQNIERHGVADRVELVHSDLLAGLRDFDLFVSNPPYVAADERLAAELAFEPSTALRAGADGMAVIRRLLPQARERLRPGGYAIIEFGAGQAAAVRAAASQTGFAFIDVLDDLAGHPRVVVTGFAGGEIR